jgi:hypothetical protein
MDTDAKRSGPGKAARWALRPKFSYSCQYYFLDRHTALSTLEGGRKIADSSREVHKQDIVDKSITFVRQKGIVPRSLRSGIAGRGEAEDHKGRVSELQSRNSFYPPQLKS